MRGKAMMFFFDVSGSWSEVWVRKERLFRRIIRRVLFSLLSSPTFEELP